MMRRLLISLVVVSLVVTSTMMVAVAQEPTVEPTEEPTVEPTEEPTVEPTEEPTVEPTEEPTVEPTEEPTVEPTEEPTVEPTVDAQGGVGAQAYSGSWTSYVTVQNMGSAEATIGIDWYPNGAAASCATTDGGTLQPGAVRQYDLPSACGTTAWIGSAVVASSEPAAAMVDTLGSVGSLTSMYAGASQGSTEPLLMPQLNNTNWDPLVGISNMGSGQASVNVTLLTGTGDVFSDPNNPYNVSIPAQSAVQVNIRNDITSSPWGGTIKVENASGSNEPLYAVVKTEREQPGMLPISMAYEAFRETSDARSEWILPVLSRNSADDGAFSEIRGFNQGIAFQNPSSTDTVNVTVEFYNGDGSLRTTYTSSLNPNGVSAVATFQVANIPASWGGTGKVTAVVQGTTTPAPIFVLIGPYYQDGTTGFTAYDVYKAVDPTSGAHQVFLPAVRKGVTAMPPGSGWTMSVNVSNLHDTLDTRVLVELIDGDGTLKYSTTWDVAANGRRGLATTEAYLASYLGANFNGGARITVEPGYPDSIVATGGGGFAGYPTTTDTLGSYNGFSP